MISWLPYRKVSFFTPYSSEETASRLSKVLVKRRVRAGLDYSEVGRFEGVVSTDGFDINRVMGYKSLTQPFLHGKFIPAEQGTQVVVKMTMLPAVWVILVLFCGGSAYLAFILISQGSTGFICPGAFFLVAYLTTVILFSIEADKAVTFMKWVFPAQRN